MVGTEKKVVAIEKRWFTLTKKEPNDTTTVTLLQKCFRASHNSLKRHAHLSRERVENASWFSRRFLKDVERLSTSVVNCGLANILWKSPTMKEQRIWDAVQTHAKHLWQIAGVPLCVRLMIFIIFLHLEPQPRFIFNFATIVRWSTFCV